MKCLIRTHQPKLKSRASGPKNPARKRQKPKHHRRSHGRPRRRLWCRPPRASPQQQTHRQPLRRVRAHDLASLGLSKTIINCNPDWGILVSSFAVWLVRVWLNPANWTLQSKRRNSLNAVHPSLTEFTFLDFLTWLIHFDGAHYPIDNLNRVELSGGLSSGEIVAAQPELPWTDRTSEIFFIIVNFIMILFLVWI